MHAALDDVALLVGTALLLATQWDRPELLIADRFRPWGPTLHENSLDTPHPDLAPDHRAPLSDIICYSRSVKGCGAPNNSFKLPKSADQLH